MWIQTPAKSWNAFVVVPVRWLRFTARGLGEERLSPARSEGAGPVRKSHGATQLIFVARRAAIGLTILLCSAQRQPPRFDEYPSRDTVLSSRLPLDGSRRVSDVRHSQLIRQAIGRGPNFAGHLVIVTWGCGTNCQQALVVDPRTGRSLGEAHATSRGVDFRLTSRLLVLDPASPLEPVSPFESQYTKYLVWNGTRLEVLDSVFVGKRN